MCIGNSYDIYIYMLTIYPILGCYMPNGEYLLLYTYL